MKKIKFEAISKIDEGTAIAIAYDFNGLFRVDLNSGKCKYMGIIPNEKMDEKRLYIQSCLSGHKVYFIPTAAKEIAVYDTINETIKKIKYNLNINKTGYIKNRNFSGAVQYGKYIFLVPCTYPAVLRIDTEDDSISYFDTCFKNEKFLFRKAIEVDGDNFFVSSTINNLVFEFNMQKCDGKLHYVGRNNSGCWSMCKKDGFYWMAPQDKGPIIKWNPLLNEFVEISTYPDEFCGDKFCFTKIYQCKGNLYLIPYKANMGVMISQNGKISPIDIPELKNNIETWFMFQLDNYLFLIVKKEGKEKEIRLNIKNNMVDTYNFVFDENDEKFQRDYAMQVLQKTKMVKENSIWGLKDFIKGVCRI